MAYDVNGNWQTYSGPLAPIRSRCSAPDSPGSIEDAFQIFTDQGFSPSQLLLGIPAYGIGYHLKSSKLEVKDFNGTLTSYYQNISAPVTVSGWTFTLFQFFFSFFFPPQFNNHQKQIEKRKKKTLAGVKKLMIIFLIFSPTPISSNFSLSCICRTITTTGCWKDWWPS